MEGDYYIDNVSTASKFCLICHLLVVLFNCELSINASCQCSNLMMEKAGTGQTHNHAILVARIGYLFVLDTPSGLSNK